MQGPHQEDCPGRDGERERERPRGLELGGGARACGAAGRSDGPTVLLLQVARALPRGGTGLPEGHRWAFREHPRWGGGRIVARAGASGGVAGRFSLAPGTPRASERTAVAQPRTAGGSGARRTRYPPRTRLRLVAHGPHVVRHRPHPRAAPLRAQPGAVPLSGRPLGHSQRPGRPELGGPLPWRLWDASETWPRRASRCDGRWATRAGSPARCAP